MKTKLIILSITLLFVSTGLNAQISIIGGKKIFGNGNESILTKKIGSFSKIQVIGDLEVVIDSSWQSELQIIGEENLIGYIRIKEKDDGTLKIINPIKHQLVTTTNKKIKVIIPYQEVSIISLSGSGDIKAKNSINVKDLSILTRGSGHIKLDVNVSSLYCKISGSGTVIISGKSGATKLVTRGNSILDVTKLKTAGKPEVVVSGSGKVKEVE